MYGAAQRAEAQPHQRQQQGDVGEDGGHGEQEAAPAGTGPGGKSQAVRRDDLGFVKKADFSQGPYRWLTVASSAEPDGTELQLERNDNPAARAFQRALKDQGARAAMFYGDDVQRDYDRIAAQGVTFTMPPTKTTGSIIAVLDDTCGNLIQLTQLTWGG